MVKGFLVARIDDGRVQLLTRTGLDWTQKIADRASAVAGRRSQVALFGLITTVIHGSIKGRMTEQLIVRPFNAALTDRRASTRLGGRDARQGSCRGRQSRKIGMLKEP
jgi:hypothetical protein